MMSAFPLHSSPPRALSSHITDTLPLVDILSFRLHSIHPVSNLPLSSRLTPPPPNHHHSIEALATRTNAHLLWTPVLLGAIYRQTAAPQGAAGSASDVFNPTKKTISSHAITRTLSRYHIPFRQPSKHPNKTTAALRLIYSLKNEDRPALTHALFKAYWVDDVDVSDLTVLREIARERGIPDPQIDTPSLRTALETATLQAVSRGAPGVPSFYIPSESWIDSTGTPHLGRLYWGQDRMHFVEAVLSSLNRGIAYSQVSGLGGLQPRCLHRSVPPRPTKMEFYYDFSSPWAFLGWTQLARMQREAGPLLEIELKPFLLGALFKEYIPPPHSSLFHSSNPTNSQASRIGAPNMPMLAFSPQKRAYSSKDQSDWIRHWNALNAQAGSPDEEVVLKWPEKFPIRSPMMLRVAIVEPRVIPCICMWSHFVFGWGFQAD